MSVGYDPSLLAQFADPAATTSYTPGSSVAASAVSPLPTRKDSPVEGGASEQSYWTTALADVQSGNRSDFIPMVWEIPSFESWMTPEKEAYYSARDADLEEVTSYSDENWGEQQTRSKSGAAGYSELQQLANAAGLSHSMNPAEYDYLSEFYQIPSYQGTGSLLEKVMHTAPVLIASAGLGAAVGPVFAGASAGASAADTAALATMGTEAGLSGSALDAFVASGGTLGSTSAGGLAGMMATSPVIKSAVQGAVSGLINGAMSGGNILESALQGAISGGAAGGVVDFAGFDSRIINAVTHGATQAAALAAINGQDIWRAAAMGAMSAFTAAGGTDAPVTPVPSKYASLYSPANPEIYQALTTEELLGLSAPPTPGTYTPAAVPMDQGMLPFLPIGPMAAQLASGPEGPEAEALDGPPDLAAEPASEMTLKDAASYAKTAKKIYDLLGIKDNPFETPQQEDDQSDEDYWEEVGNYAVEYLSLDPDAMREAGLVPGTQEYLDYILQQADAIIAGVLGENPEDVIEGADVADLQAALRDLTEQEAQQLARALYARGALGELTLSADVVDPFTGVSEETGMLSGDKVSSAKAGQQRGYARSVESLLGMSRRGAAEALRGLLGRDVDLFDLQGSADARALAAQLAELEEDETRKRRGGGMVGGDADYWDQILSDMDPRQFESLMSQFGSRDRQDAAIEQLMGWEY